MIGIKPFGFLPVNTFWFHMPDLLSFMSDDALIRLENLKALNLGPGELSASVGSSYQYWRDLLAGHKSFGEKAARKIEEKLGLTRGSLDASSGARKPAPVEIDLENNPDYPAVRRVNIKAQAGVSGYAVEYMGDDGHPIVFRRDWYTLHNYDPARMLALRVTGESMVPNLYAGDMIVINTAKTDPQDGIAFLVSYEGEVMVKRLVRDDGQWWLSSDNADQRRFPRKRCNGETQIIGEVVYRQTERI